MQVKLFVELFTSKYQALFFKLLRATGDEVDAAAKEFAHNLQVGVCRPAYMRACMHMHVCAVVGSISAVASTCSTSNKEDHLSGCMQVLDSFIAASSSSAGGSYVMGSKCAL